MNRLTVVVSCLFATLACESPTSPSESSSTQNLSSARSPEPPTPAVPNFKGLWQGHFYVEGCEATGDYQRIDGCRLLLGDGTTIGIEVGVRHSGRTVSKADVFIEGFRPHLSRGYINGSRLEIDRVRAQQTVGDVDYFLTVRDWVRYHGSPMSGLFVLDFEQEFGRGRIIMSASLRNMRRGRSSYSVGGLDHPTRGSMVDGLALLNSLLP